MNESNFLSRQQQEFNASLMRSIPVLRDFQMQYYIGKGKKLLEDHLSKLQTIFWVQIWEAYYMIRWKEKVDFSFVVHQKKPQNFDYLLIVAEFKHYASMLGNMYSNGLLVLADDPEQENVFVIDDMFKFNRRIERTYAIWHQGEPVKVASKFISRPEDVFQLKEEYKSEVMNLFETLLWYDFMDVVSNSFYFDQSICFGFGKNEITRCISTMSLHKKGMYASVICEDGIRRVCESTFFGGSIHRDNNGMVQDYVRRIAF
jgi:hypothetical protein